MGVLLRKCCFSTFRRYYSAELNGAGAKATTSQPMATWLTLFKEKQDSIPYHITFQKLAESSPGLIQYTERTSNLQHVLTGLSMKRPKGVNEKLDKSIIFRSLEDLNTEESAFVLLVLCIIKCVDDSICGNNGKVIRKCLNTLKNDKGLNAIPMTLSSKLSDLAPFGKDNISKIVSDEDIQLALAFLNKKLGKDYSFDDIFMWINSLFEPSIPTALKQLVGTKTIPTTILYDILLRSPKNELEYQYSYEIYKSHYQKLNILDQEKFHQLKQFETHFNRQLVIPPLFMNLFKYALRHKCEDLPKLIGMFLESNSIPDENTINQLGEMAWYLSIDHTGEFIGKPSRHYYISQSMIIKSINEMIKEDKSLEVDVTTILAVSNLSYYKNPQKAYKLFKSAKQHFDHWKIQAFKPDNFERISSSSSSGENLPKNIVNEMIEDYNIKFLCNSIILLHVNEENHLQISKDLRQIFQQVESKVLKDYPEVWGFILVKLSYHHMISGSIYGFLIDGYCSQIKLNNNSYPYALDVLIKDAKSFSSIQPILTNVNISKFDDNNIAHLISKLYKFGPGKLEDDLQHINVIELARDLYLRSPFKSSKVNSAYLLGESIVTPNETYERYISMNQNFKVSPLTISALFISISKMVEMGGYEDIKWGESTPVEFAFGQYDKYISQVFNDGLIYPNDHLLGIYIDVLKKFGEEERLTGLLDTLVDLKYPLGVKLFDKYLDGFGGWDKEELMNCLNTYNKGFQMVMKNDNDMRGGGKKMKLPKVTARGQFKKFVNGIELNWGVIGKWKWSGKE